jgi:hypothetical protein
MLVDQGAAVGRIYGLRDDMVAGKSIPLEVAITAINFLEVILEDSGEAAAEGLLAAAALLSSRQSSLFYPLLRQAMKPLVRRGIRHSHEAARFGQALLRKPKPVVELDDHARNWLRREFLLLAVPIQDMLDQIVAERMNST